MSDFDNKLKALLADGDDVAFSDQIDERGYYRSVLDSFSGQGAGLRIMGWGAILIWGSLLILCLVQLFRVQGLEAKLIYATFAIILNSAQIAMKLWFNMQINRRAVIKEIRILQALYAESLERR